MSTDIENSLKKIEKHLKALVNLEVMKKMRAEGTPDHLQNIPKFKEILKQADQEYRDQ